jgi:hypothetical protein
MGLAECFSQTGTDTGECIPGFWGRILCRFLHKCQRFEGVCCLHLQGCLGIFWTTLNIVPVCQSLLSHDPRILNIHWPHCSRNSCRIMLTFVQSLRLITRPSSFICHYTYIQRTCCNCNETPGNRGNTNENLDLQEDENFEAILSWLPSILGVQKSRAPLRGPSIRNLFNITLLASRILRWLLGFRKICGPSVHGLIHLKQRIM